MNKLRVFQTVEKRRIVPGFFPKNLGTILLLLLLLPYLITSLSGNVKEGTSSYGNVEEVFQEGSVFVNNITPHGSESIPLEVYVADRLGRCINENFEPEALKAQAVLIRSSLLASLYETGKNKREVKEIEVEDMDYGSLPVSEKILEAVAKTTGVCLTFNDRPVNGAYFAVSNGATRDAKELFSGEYPYLKSVPCARDFLSEDYTFSVGYSKLDFDSIWGEIPELSPVQDILEKEKQERKEEIEGIALYKDSAGYVLYVLSDEKSVSGEEFRNYFHLPSASFHLSEEERKIFITGKGVGHGIGMSQFGANEMAKDGSDYVEILNYFFQDVIITKFE